MATLFELQMAFTGPDNRATAAALRDYQLFDGEPVAMLIDNKRQDTPGPGWLEEATRKATLGWSAWFGGRPGPIGRDGAPGLPQGPYGLIKEEYGAIKLVLRPWTPSMADFIDLLAAVPFYQASTFTLHPKWFNPGNLRVKQPFIRMNSAHHPHGFAAALRGPGHQAMCSPRWLEQGPWKVWRRNDITIVQFHDLNADEDTAFHQAEPGWHRFGRTDEGGLLPADAVELKGSTYVIPDRMLRIDVRGELSPKDLSDLASWRVRRTKHPVERIRLVFPTHELAEMHLYQCWIRSLECCYRADDEDHRIDEDYSVEPMELSWVTALGDVPL